MSSSIRFVIKKAKKRKRSEAADASFQKRSDENNKKLGNIFLSAAELEAETNVMRETHQSQKEVPLLEDTSVRVKRLQNEGCTLAEDGRFQVAMMRWTEALEMDPTNAVLYELLAQASMQVYEDFRAIQFAQMATKLAPEWSDAFHTLARCHLNYGELELASQYIQKAIALNDGANDELLADQQEIESLLRKQAEVLWKRDHEAAQEVDEGKLQAISCLKHLSLRARTITTTSDGSSSRDEQH